MQLRSIGRNWYDAEVNIPEFDTVDSSHFDKICQPRADNAKLDKFGETMWEQQAIWKLTCDP